MVPWVVPLSHVNWFCFSSVDGIIRKGVPVRSEVLCRGGRECELGWLGIACSWDCLCNGGPCLHTPKGSTVSLPAPLVCGLAQLASDSGPRWPMRLFIVQFSPVGGLLWTAVWTFCQSWIYLKCVCLKLYARRGWRRRHPEPAWLWWYSLCLSQLKKNTRKIMESNHTQFRKYKNHNSYHFNTIIIIIETLLLSASFMCLKNVLNLGFLLLTII